jgi:hypothetical protein
MYRPQNPCCGRYSYKPRSDQAELKEKNKDCKNDQLRDSGSIRRNKDRNSDQSAVNDQPASKFGDMIHERESLITGHAIHAG